MNCYEHTLIARQDLQKKSLEEIKTKYQSIIEQNKGKVVKLEEWGLMIFSIPIKQNKRGYYLHFKFEGEGKIVEELEKKERIDDQLLRFMTVKYKKLDLKNTGLWTRVNAINSKWFLDDVSYIIENLANKLDVIMLPMINTSEEILFADRIIALNEAKYQRNRRWH